MCGRKGPGARTRGRRRHPRKLGGTPPRSPGGARAAEETAYPLALRMPRGSRWGRWREGVLTRPKPQAARYPAGCPPLSAARCGEAEEACPNVSRGCGGMCPPSLPSCDEGEGKLPTPAICGRGQRRLAGGPGHLRRYPAAWPAAGSAAPCRPAKREAGLSPAVQAGRLGRRPPRSSCWTERTTRGHNGCAGKEACLPRALLRGVQADAGAQCPPLSCGVRPGRDGCRSGLRAMRTSVFGYEESESDLPACASLLEGQGTCWARAPRAILSA